MAAGVAMLALAACGENTWNDQLDGFAVPPTAPGTETKAYTLTDADYTAIAKANLNKESTHADSVFYNAIANNKSFANEEDANKCIPSLLNNPKGTLPYYFLNNGSNVNVTYNLTTAQPQLMQDVNAGTVMYTVSKEDYAQVWKNDDFVVNAFNPDHKAAEYIPNMLASGTRDNECATVTYAYTSQPTSALTAESAKSLTLESKIGLFKWDGKAWKEVVDSNVIVLQASDYTAMGLKFTNLSPAQADGYLPIYLQQTLPYAQVDWTRIVVFNEYLNKVNTFKARQYKKTAEGWIIDAAQGTSKFTRMNGAFTYNPSIEVTLPYARTTEPSQTVYQAAVDWVMANVPDAMKGDPNNPQDLGFINYRKNAEFYSGCSAFYGNLDLRASSARTHVPLGYTGYDGMSDEQVVNLMKQRFCLETMHGALEKVYSTVKPAEGLEVTVKVNFTAYTPAVEPGWVVYTVVAPGKLEYKNSSWYPQTAPWQK